MTQTVDRGSAHELLILHRLDQTYWGKRIIAAEQNEGFDADDYEAANCWTDCACGKLSQEIPRRGSGGPQDVKLYDLGKRFAKLCGDDDLSDFDQVFAAAELLIEIEQRAHQVILALKK